MADSVELLRQATQLQMQCSDYLAESEAMQRCRWDRLHQCAELAGDQFMTMRIDVVEERLRDQGAPAWLSVIIGLTVSLLPVTAMTSSFISVLTGSTQKLLTRSSREALESIQSVMPESGWAPLGVQARLLAMRPGAVAANLAKQQDLADRIKR